MASSHATNTTVWPHFNHKHAHHKHKYIIICLL